MQTPRKACSARAECSGFVCPGSQTSRSGAPARTAEQPRHRVQVLFPAGASRDPRGAPGEKSSECSLLARDVCTRPAPPRASPSREEYTTARRTFEAPPTGRRSAPGRETAHLIVTSRHGTRHPAPQANEFSRIRVCQFCVSSIRRRFTHYNHPASLYSVSPRVSALVVAVPHRLQCHPRRGILV